MRPSAGDPGGGAPPAQPADDTATAPVPPRFQVCAATGGQPVVALVFLLVGAVMLASAIR